MKQFNKLILLFIFVFLSSLSYANTQFADISKEWVGLVIDRGKVKRIVVTFEKDSAAPVTESSAYDKKIQQRAAKRMAHFRSRNPQHKVPETQLGDPIVGQVILDAAKYDISDQNQESASYSLSGKFIPELNLIKFEYKSGQGNVASLLGAFSEDKKQIYLVYGGLGSKQGVPFVLYEGYNMPSYLDDVADPWEEVEQARHNGFSREYQQQYQQQSSALQRKQFEARQANNKQLYKEITDQIAKLNKEYKQRAEQHQRMQREAGVERSRKVKVRYRGAVTAEGREKIQAVQRQISVERRAGNHEKANELVQALRELELEQQDIANGRNAKLREQAGNGCMAKLASWFGEFDKHGGSIKRGGHLIDLVNLFRPSVFNKHFDQNLIDMDESLREGYGYELMKVCPRYEESRAYGSNLGVIGSGFGEERRALHYVNAFLAGIALDGVDEWQQRTIDELVKGENWSALAEFEIQAHYLVSALWPSESEKAFTLLAEHQDKAQLNAIMAEVDERVKQANSKDQHALLYLAQTYTLSNWNELDEAARKQVVEYMNKAIAPLLDDYFDTHRPPSTSNGKTPKQILIAGKKWHQKHAALLATYSKSEPVQKLMDKFLSQREANFKAIAPKLKSDIASIDSSQALHQIGSTMVLGIDNQLSTAWRDIAQAKKRRLAQLEQAAFIARVGEGPLKPGDDGAVYVNALYRNDYKILAEEDKKFANAMVKMSGPVLNSGIFELMSAFSGNRRNPEAIKQEVRNRISGISMATAMTGLFIVAYEHLAPQCLGANPIDFKRTVTWDEVTKNGLGMELYRQSFSKTYHYTIAQRHAELFKRLGQGTSAGSLDALGTLYGAFGIISPDVQQSIFTLSDNLRGVASVMRQYECNSKEMKTLEKALIDITKSRENL